MILLDQATRELRIRQDDGRGDDDVITREPHLDEVAAIVRARLQASAYGEVRSLTCVHHEGILVLRGRVSTYYHKQLAQEAVRHLAGVEAVINTVEVEVS